MGVARDRRVVLDADRHEDAAAVKSSCPNMFRDSYQPMTAFPGRGTDTAPREIGFFSVAFDRMP